jgi:hypothetical protein
VISRGLYEKSGIFARASGIFARRSGIFARNVFVRWYVLKEWYFCKF